MRLHLQTERRLGPPLPTTRGQRKRKLIKQGISQGPRPRPWPHGSRAVSCRLSFLSNLPCCCWTIHRRECSRVVVVHYLFFSVFHFVCLMHSISLPSDNILRLIKDCFRWFTRFHNCCAPTTVIFSPLLSLALCYPTSYTLPTLLCVIQQYFGTSLSLMK